MAGLLCLLTSCCKKVTDTHLSEDKQRETLDLSKYKLVIVIDYRELDGCNFILKLADGHMLIPENLSDTLKKDQLKIMVRYMETHKATICMAGSSVSILDAKWPAEK